MRLLPSALLCATALTAVPALAHSGATVAAGGASIATPSANTTIVTQTSEKAIINWQSLNVPAGGLLQFLQPNAGAIALNRVLGGTPSSILGSLIANGQVWIINPAGILFGRGASVNVAGLIATTSNISDQNFLNGTYVFDQPTANASAAVVNNGTISVASGGAAVLAGERVANNGLIEANLGQVTLAAGNAFTVDFNGDSLISFAISAPVSETPQGRGGTAAQALVSNSGTLSAAGGEVLLTAQAARTVLTNAINTTGMISATTAHDENGEIVLDAGPTGAANVSGTLDASGKGAGQTGGAIAVTGGSVTIAANAVLDASGDQGGGTIALGGDLHGAGPLADAAAITVAPGAVINASAITSGNGGTVSVWSSGTTTFNGTILVEGGAEGGNGGLAETSGADLSVTSGTVNALAATGAAGTWLLDPLNIIVATGGTASLGNVGSFSSNPGATDTIAPSVIDGATANVALDATHDITFTNAVAITTAGIGLTATAGDSIFINAAITTNAGALKFVANSGAAGTASGSGSISLGASASLTTTATTGSASPGSITLQIAGTGTTSSPSTGTIGVSPGASIDGGAVTVTAIAAVTLPSIDANTLTVTGSSISQNGALTIAGGSGLTATTGGITLANPANSFGVAVYLSAGAAAPAGSSANATIASAGAITFGNVTTTGGLTIQSGGVTGNLPFSVGGTLDLDVSTGSVISLSSASNVFSGPIVFSGNALGTLQLNSSRAISLPALDVSGDAAADVAGDLILLAPGITQTGAWTVAGQTELNARGDNVVLSNAANSFTGEFFTFNAGNVAVTAAAPVDFGTVTINQNLSVTAPGIVQDETLGLTVPGTLALSVGSANSIVLDSAYNSFSGPVVVSGGAANVTLVNTVALTLSPLDISGALSVTAPGIALAGTYATGAGQSYAGAVTLGGSVTLSDSSLSGIVFQNAVSGAGDTLTVASGPVTFEAGATLGALSTQAATLDGTIATTAGQSYADAVTLGGNVTLSDSGTGITFDSTISGAGDTLTIASGPVTFDAGATLGALSTQAATLDGTVTTTAGQTYAGAVTLAGNVTLSDSGTGITFDSTISGVGDALTIASGPVTFDAGATLAALSTQAATLAGSITTGDGQTYGGPVTLAADTTLADNAFLLGPGILFESTVTGPGRSLEVTTGSVTFDGAVVVGRLFLQGPEALSPIETADVGLDDGGVVDTASDGIIGIESITLGANVTTTGGQTYGGPVTLASNVTLSDSGSGITFESTVTGAGTNLIVSNGTIAFYAGATLGSLSVQGASLDGTIATSGSQTYAGPIALLGNTTLAASGGSSTIAFSGNSAFDTGSSLAVLAGGNVTVSGTIENAGSGAITLVAGWDGVTAASLAPTTASAFGLGGATLTIGGATASGNAAVGSAGGATTVAAGNLDLLGQSGFAQLGFDGGGATGTLSVALTGNLTMTGGGAGDYVQIGHGGLGTSGSESGAISVAAAGTIALDGGSGTDAYAQIGHGGALSNEGTTVAFSDTGDIAVSGLGLTLTAGAGDGAYVQIGHGGLDAGASATLSSGSINISGNITVASTDPLTMAGDGLSAYAQIGNGGFGADGHATLANGGAITESGDIDVTTGTSASSGAVELVGDAYAQIGNGGYAINEGASAAGGIDESGAISLDVLGPDGSGRLVGGDTGPWAYAQIGNGDASGTGEGNVSGGISMSLATPIQLVNGTAATAWMWNATGIGTVSGTTSVDGAVVFPPGEAPAPPPPPPTTPTFDLSDLPGFDSLVATDSNAPPPVTNDNPTPISASGSVAFNGGTTNAPTDTGDTSSLAASLNALAPTAGGPSSGAGAIEELTDSSRSGGNQGGESAGAAQEGDELSSEVALSLTGKASATQPTTCIRTGTGETILCQIAASPGAGKTPVGVQPADQPYSSWGNDALWQE